MEFINTPSQSFVPSEYKFSEEERNAMEIEIKDFLTRGIIEEAQSENGQIVSNIFCRKKKSGKVRIIGNFIHLNKNIEYKKFKQDTVKTVLDMVRPNCYMVSIDLTDAYYTIPIHKDSRKFLRFLFNGKLYQFKSLPQGLGLSPRLFTKIMKVALSALRSQNVIICAFLDDLIIFANSYDECIRARDLTLELLQKLGYMINWDKSVLEPSHTIEHLGLILNSDRMIVTIGKEKCDNVIKLCNNLKQAKFVTVRQVAKLVGTMIAYTPGVENGLLHYRALEKCKIEALRKNKFNFDGICEIDENAINDINWWIYNVHNQCSVLNRLTIHTSIETDSCKTGWGAVRGDAKTAGTWTVEEQSLNVNILEMRASLYGLMALCDKVENAHIRVWSDSFTGVKYINARGGIHSEECNKIAYQIWEWALVRNNFISAVHIPGVKNKEADFLSRNTHKHSDSEWKLNKKIFDTICLKLGTPSIDLFAAHNNAQLARFVSWFPDPKATACNVFHNTFENEFFYAFPPINCINNFLRKVELEKMEGILVAPLWTTQPYFSLLHRLIVKVPLKIKWKEDVLHLPHSTETHRLGKRLKLGVFLLSTKVEKREKFIKLMRKKAHIVASVTHTLIQMNSDHLKINDTAVHYKLI